MTRQLLALALVSSTAFVTARPQETVKPQIFPEGTQEAFKACAPLVSEMFRLDPEQYLVPLNANGEDLQPGEDVPVIVYGNFRASASACDRHFAEKNLCDMVQGPSPVIEGSIMSTNPNVYACHCGQRAGEAPRRGEEDIGMPEGDAYFSSLIECYECLGSPEHGLNSSEKFLADLRWNEAVVEVGCREDEDRLLDEVFESARAIQASMTTGGSQSTQPTFEPTSEPVVEEEEEEDDTEKTLTSSAGGARATAASYAAAALGLAMLL